MSFLQELGGRQDPIRCWCQREAACTAPSLGGLHKEFFRVVQQRAQIHQQKLWKRLPSSMFTKGQGGGYAVVYQAWEVNLHSECFNNSRGYKYQPESTEVVSFVGTGAGNHLSCST